MIISKVTEKWSDKLYRKTIFMKSSIVITLLSCVLLVNESPAQFIRSYGAKVAYTSAELVYNDTEWNNPILRRSGFNAAVFIEWLDVPFVSVVTQLEYAQRGKSFDTYVQDPGSPKGYSVKDQVSDRLDYLSIPIMGKIRIPLGMFSPFITAGPRADFLLGYRSYSEWDDSIYDKFKKTNVGATISLGSEVKPPLPFTLSLEARYNVDLASAYSITSYRIAHNNSFDVWLGIGF
jgi:hypothetical protein